MKESLTLKVPSEVLFTFFFFFVVKRCMIILRLMPTDFRCRILKITIIQSLRESSQSYTVVRIGIFLRCIVTYDC